MLSLDKTKDWSEFIQYFGNKDVVGMVKLERQDFVIFMTGPSLSWTCL